MTADHPQPPKNAEMKIAIVGTAGTSMPHLGWRLFIEGNDSEADSAVQGPASQVKIEGLQLSRAQMNEIQTAISQVLEDARDDEAVPEQQVTRFRSLYGTVTHRVGRVLQWKREQLAEQQAHLNDLERLNR